MRCFGLWSKAPSASFTLDVGLYTEITLFTIHARPITFEGHIGNLQLNYTKAQANIGQSKALALLMEL